MSWTAPSGTVTGFDVHYTSAPTSGTGAVANDAAAQGNDPATAWVAVSRSGTTASQTITNLTLGTTYRVRVRAVNANGNSAWVFGPETTVDSSPPDAPADVVTTVTSTSVCARWAEPANNGAEVWGYAVQYERPGQSGSAIRNAPTFNERNPPTRRCIFGLTPETTYEIKVRARNVKGWGPFSQPVSFVTPQASQAPPADAPANVVVLAVTNTAARVSWAAPTNNVAAVTAYEVHYTTAPATGANAVADDAAATGSDPATAWVAVFRSDATASHTISGLTTGTAYRVRVRYHLSDSKVSNWAFAQGTLARSTPSLAQATANGTTLTLAYSDLLNENSVPPATAFTVKMDGEPVRLAGRNPVSISGAAVILSLAEAVDAGRKVTVSYRQLPASDPIRNSWSYKAFELLNQPVTVSGICGRTPVVRQAILNELEALIGTAPDCADVTSAQLSRITGAVDAHNLGLLLGTLLGISSLQETDFRGLSSLERLGISGTRNLPHRKELITPLFPASDFKRHPFPLTSLPENLFQDLSSLKEVGITGTSVTSLPENLYHGLSSLETLSIAINPALTSLPENLFDGLSSLTELRLVQSPSLSALPENLFDGLSSLETLVISATGLTSVSENLFDGLTSLERLELHSNRKLSTLSANAFNDLTNLKSLKIIFSPLSSLPRNAFNGLSSLTGLALNNNAITKVHPTVFHGLSSLTNLNLGNNERIEYRGVHTARGDNALSSLPPNFFEGLTSLTHLRLNYISLRSLPLNLFDGLPLRHLYVEGNPWLRGFPTDLFAPSHSLWVLQVNNIGLTCLTPALAQRKQLIHDGGENALPERNLPDCPAVSLSASPNSVREGSPVTITATMTEVASRDRRILLWTTPGTAETRENYGTGDIGGDDDYVPLQQIIIPAGETSGTGIVRTIRDGDKDDETFTVALFREGSSQMPGLSHGTPSSVEVTIKETASVSVSATPQVEEGSPVTVTATLSEPLSQAVRIPLYQRQGTAEPGDYEELRTSSRLDGTFEIEIPVGQTMGTATIRTTRDDDGDNETFSVAIDHPFLPSGLQWGDPLSAQVTIIDSAQLAQIYVSGPPSSVVHEDRDSGARFVVHLPRAVPHSFTVDYATKDGTVSTQYKPQWRTNGGGLDRWITITNSPAATAPADYTTTAGTLTFAPGEKQKIVFVPIVNDTVSDSDENFRFAVMNPSAGARIAYGEASVVILNDEADLSALTAEGAAGAGGPWSALDIGAFAAETTDYAVTVPSATTHVRLRPTAAEPGTTMRTGAGSNLEAVRSGEPGQAVALEAGENTLIVAAVAPSGARKTYTVTVTLSRQAWPVVAAPIADVGALEAGTSRKISLSGVFSDADSDRLTISAGSSDTSKAAVSVAADSSALTLSGVAAGTATITVTAVDSDGNRVSDHFDVTVAAPPNNAPTVASAIADIGALEAGAKREVSLSGVFSDPDGDALTISVTTSDRAIVNISTALDGTTLSATAVTVIGVAEGTATITVTAQDPDGNSVSDAFDVTVPAAEAAQQQQVEAVPGQVVNLSVRQTQPTRIRVEWEAPEDGGAVNSYQVVLSRDGEELSTRRPGAKKRHVVIRKLEPGATYTVSVRAKNAGGLGPVDTAQITLTASVGEDDGAEVPAVQQQQAPAQQQQQVPVNQPPTVAAPISDITGLRGGDTRQVSLSGVFSDADSDALIVSAKSSSATVATVSVATDGASLTVTAVAEGTATITVSADDGNGGTVSDSFTVAVAGNAAPRIASSIGDLSGLKAGDTRQVSLSGVFSDADSDALTVSGKSSAAAVATVSIATDGTSLTVTAVAEGTATITVTANDGNGGTISDSFTVTVAGNAAPKARRSLGDISVTESETARVLLEDTFRDADNDRLTITAASSDETVVRVSLDYNYYAMTVSAVSAGAATVTVTADDGNGSRASESFAVTVAAQPAPSSASESSPAAEEAAAAEQEDVLVRYDTNGDGKISSEEYQAALPDLGFTLTLDELIRLRAAYVASAR